MLTSHAVLAPHRPTLLQDQSRGHATEMLKALAGVKERLLEQSPHVFVVVSARWDSPNGPLLVDAGKRHRTITDYHGFGSELRYDCPGRPALARKLVEAGLRAKLRVAETVRGVDSGVAIPLHFLAPARRVPVVPLSIAPLPTADHRRWGAVLRQMLEALPDRVAFVVGGGLAHNEHAFNLHREVPEAAEFDQQALEAIRAGDWVRLLATPGRTTLERAQPEAGFRHLELLRGFLGRDVAGEVRCYEPGQGMGAVLVEFPTGTEAAEPPRAVAGPDGGIG